MRLSVIIPARNEAETISATIEEISSYLKKDEIEHEILVINDKSNDKTTEVVQSLNVENVFLFDNGQRQGLAGALSTGVMRSKGDLICFMMADGSEFPEDLLIYYKMIMSGYDCAFGDRWGKRSLVQDYPGFKFIMNRIYNNLLSLIFNLKYRDITNAFKMYKREVLLKGYPLKSIGFEITVELPLKAIKNGFSFGVCETRWRNRTKGRSKFSFLRNIAAYTKIAVLGFRRLT